MEKRIKEMYERIEEIITYYNLTISSFSREIGLNSPATIQKIITYKRGASIKTRGRILKRFPDINNEWLLTGRGDMLKSKINKENAVKFNNYNDKHLIYIEKVSEHTFKIKRELIKTAKKCDNINIKNEILEQISNLDQVNQSLMVLANKLYW